MSALGSTFSWLDHSEEHRRRMMEVVQAFREKNTVDELGIGSVRDTLSEILFPGTSTLHTRAKYLLFVPWICVGMERDRVPARRASERLRNDEIRLIYALESGGEREGVIGIEARENLKQVPSSMYWSAFGRYGIRVLPASRAQYLRSLDGDYERLKGVETDDDGNPVGAGVPRNWHASLPEPEEDFLEETTFALHQANADYLTERILDRCKRTYLAHLVVQDEPQPESAFPWEVPAVASAPTSIQEHVEHARTFSELLQGGSLLYNLIVAQMVRRDRTAGGQVEIDEDKADEYQERLDEWSSLIEHRRDAHTTWDRQRFWELVLNENPRVPRGTRRFVNRWCDIAIERPDALADDEHARQLIREREIAVKGALARVANTRARERWRGASGVSQFAFRWGQVSTVTRDIVEGQSGVAEAAGA